MSKPLPASAAEHLDLIWNDPDAKKLAATALTILKEQDAPKKPKPKETA
jgi:hypothetical protein